MSEARSPKTDPIKIGEEALPQFAVLPKPSSLFDARAKRFEAVASGHPLAPYLSFLAGLSQVQHDIEKNLPPVALPEAEDIEQALSNGMPPLPAAGLALDDAALLTVERLLAGASALEAPQPTKAALEALLAMDADARKSILVEALTRKPTPDEIAGRVLVLAGLQVHFARLAARLDAHRLKPIANGVCPACGSAPVSSSVVGWPKLHNMRFCTCSLCSTMWNVVRVKCVLCSSTEGITYHGVEGGSEHVKAEACSSCKRYVKVLYQVKDHTLEAVADDVATLGLDMLLAKEDWQRGSSNPFLLGY